MQYRVRRRQDKRKRAESASQERQTEGAATTAAHKAHQAAAAVSDAAPPAAAGDLGSAGHVTRWAQLVSSCARLAGAVRASDGLFNKGRKGTVMVRARKERASQRPTGAFDERQVFSDLRRCGRADGDSNDRQMSPPAVPEPDAWSEGELPPEEAPSWPDDLGVSPVNHDDIRLARYKRCVRAQR